MMNSVRNNLIMKIAIISYNHKAINVGMIIFHLGFVLLFINVIPFVWYNYGIYVVYLSILMLFSGAISVNYYTKRVKEIGTIHFEEKKTKISINTKEIEIINENYNVKFSNTGYEGKSNYIPFLTIGSFTTNPGVNSISFYNEKNKFRYEILVKSKTEYNKLKSIIKEMYKK